MKIAIIDPVVGTSDEVLAADAAYMKKYLNPNTEFTVERLSSGFMSVETAAQDTINGAKIIEKVVEIQDKGYDGIFIDCFDDPGVLGARELSKIPVMGPYVPAIHYAASISEKVAVITTDSYGVVCEGRKAGEHGFEDVIAAVKNVNMTVLELDDEILAQKIKEICLELESEGINAAVMGCTGMDGVADKVRAELKASGCSVQLIEPLKVGMKMLELAISLQDTNLIKSTPINMDEYIR